MVRRNAEEWERYFAGLSDGNLKQAWQIYGRESENCGTTNELNAWAAVNQEMWERDLI